MGVSIHHKVTVRIHRWLCKNICDSGKDTETRMKRVGYILVNDYYVPNIYIYFVMLKVRFTC